MTFIQQIGGRSRGTLGGFVLGLTLGIVWIPCVGPILSGVLAIVAAEGRFGQGIWMLFVYTAGFSIPILLAGYASHFFRSRFKPLRRFQVLIRVASGSLLVALGLIMMTRGMIFFGTIGI